MSFLSIQLVFFCLGMVHLLDLLYCMPCRAQPCSMLRAATSLLVAVTGPSIEHSRLIVLSSGVWAANIDIDCLALLGIALTSEFPRSILHHPRGTLLIFLAIFKMACC